jgi:hypothetical protein
LRLIQRHAMRRGGVAGVAGQIRAGIGEQAGIWRFGDFGHAAQKSPGKLPEL